MYAMLIKLSYYAFIDIEFVFYLFKNKKENGAAFEAGGLEVGQLILEVDGHRVEG